MTININTITDINDSDSIEDLRKIIIKFLAHYDLKDFGYAIQIPNINKVQSPYIISEYEKDWLNHYKSNEYYKIDPTILYSIKNILPVRWENVLITSDTSNKKFIEESKDAGLLNGVAYPIHGCYGEKGIFCIASKNKIGDELFLNTNIIIPYIHNKILELDLNKYTHFIIPKLTVREKEFLKWLAIGKTMEEIAQIMSISYRTCVHYNEKLKIKFNCSSKNQVIALAIIKQIINV